MSQEFFLLGSIIVIGFFSLMFFERTKIPDVLFLILLGVLLGPVLHVVDASPTSLISQLLPFVGTLALIILLFDGGINLNIFKVVKELGKASVFTLLVFLLALFFVGFAMKILAGWQLVEGLLLGAVIGGSSSAVVVSIISKISMPEENKTVLTLESALTDALCVIATFTLLGIIVSNSLDISRVGNQLASAFSIAFMVAAAFAIVWIVVLQRFYGKPFGFLLTIAVLFIMYAFVESIGGNGAIAVLVFGVLLSSMQELAKLLKIEGDFGLEKKLREFQVEISFFVRTFFFVYLGLIINFADLPPNVIILSTVLLILIFLSRYLGVRLLSQLFTDSRQNILIISMMPRGLAAAVLAFIPASAAYGVKLPYFSELVFLIIIYTNVIATVGVYAYESGSQGAKPRIVATAQHRYPYSKK
ncbi:MAG: cation:proton antiporter [Candidatus Micrarchaeota archaeon]